jgi:hypothetical protein
MQLLLLTCEAKTPAGCRVDRQCCGAAIDAIAVSFVAYSGFDITAASSLCACLLQLKLNTDESPGVATEYGIRSIPTVMLFKDGVKQVGLPLPGSDV